MKRQASKGLNLKEGEPSLHIIIHNCRCLPAMDPCGTSDPYVLIKVGKEQVKTQTIKKTLNPDFEEQFFIPVEPALVAEESTIKSLLEIDVFDWDFLSKDDYIGSVKLNLKILPNGKTVKKTFKLDGVGGDITVSITANNFGVNRSDIDKLQDGAEYEYLSLADSGLECVVKKLEASLYAQQFKSKSELLKFAELLSNVHRLKATYLTTKWAATMSQFDKLVEESSTAVAASSSESAKESSEVEAAIKLASSLMPDEALETNVHVKLLIVDQDQEHQTKQNVRKFFSPVLSSLELLPKVGFFHSALIIGPWLIEWNNSGLCVPRKCTSKAALITADMAVISTRTDLNDTVNKLANIIVQWNTSKFYKANPDDLQKYGNCQQFVESVLNQLGVKMEFQGPLGSFLQKLRKRGNSSLKFKMDSEFMKKFKITGSNKVKFSTHQQLDQFVSKLLVIDPAFERNHSQEYQFLKSFDRAFWVRHYKMIEMATKTRMKIKRLEQQNATAERAAAIEELKEYEETDLKVRPALLKEQDSCLCPFGDPEVTGSMIIAKRGSPATPTSATTTHRPQPF